MKICITGIAGFIGSTLAKQLVKDGHTVTGIDSLAWGYTEDIPKECEWVCLDLIYLDRWVSGASDYSKGRLPKIILGDVDLMIHCAANIEVLASLAEPTSDLRINVEGTVQVLEAMKQYDIKNIINFSSACVYGRGANPMNPNCEAWASTSAPHWPYGASKLAAEIYCNLYVHKEGFNVINVRPSIICGPGEWYGRALTIFLKRALEQKPIVVFTDSDYDTKKHIVGDGTPTRDFMHIDDVVAQVKAFLKNYPEHFFGPQTFNMGSGKQSSIMELAKLVGRRLDAEVVAEVVAQGAQSKMIEGRTRIPGEMAGMLLDMDQAKRRLDFTPTLTLANIVDDEIAWLTDEGGLERWQASPMKT